MVTSRPQAHHSSSSFGSSAAASTILGAFGRRPRTATNSRDRQGLPTDYSESTDDLQRIASRNRFSLIARAGIPRSNSSSQVNRVPAQESTSNSASVSRFAFPSSTADGARASSSMAQHQTLGSSSSRPMSNGDIVPPFHTMDRTHSSQSASGGSAIGRYFRRYSQGAGKNMAAALEARSVASGSLDNRGISQDTSGAGLINNTTDATPSSLYTSAINDSTSAGGTMSASQTMPTLYSTRETSAPLQHASDFTSATEGALASVTLENANDERSAIAVPNASNTNTSASGTHRIRLVPHLEATRSLHFEPIERDLVEGSVAVKIGRFTDRSMASSAAANTITASGQAAPSAIGNMTRSETETNLLNAQTSSAAPASSSAIPTSGSSVGVPGARGGAILSSAGGGGRVDSGRIAFKSKVVSRGHAEVWCEGGGKFFIRDTKSSSGTFLNHIRLSHPNVESKPFPLKDGDVVQLGVDYQGGTEEIYRCVKMRVELNRGWQRGANQFNVNALRQLRALQGTPLPEAGAIAATTTAASALPTNRQSMNVTDCCICLFSVTVCQALFIAPCSHVFHFKCIRPLIEQHHPGFSCPLCRTFADLDADVEEDEAWQQALLKEAQLGDGKANIGVIDISTPMAEEPSLNFASVGLPLTAGSSSQSFGIRSIVENAGSDREAHSRRETSLRRAVLGPQTGDESEGSSSHDRHQSTESPDTSPNSLDNVHQSTSIEPASQSISNERSYGSLYQSPASHQDRRPSAPISIRRSQGATTQTLPARSPNEGFAMSPSFLDARTPQNEHFLSTLAEAPPPSRVAMRSIDLSLGDHTLFPGSSLTDQRRVSNATNNSSHHGTNEAFTTPAQGNSPPADISPISALTRSQRVSDEEGNVEVGTANSSTALHSKGKSPDSMPSGMQNAIDFLTGSNSTFGGSTAQQQVTPRRTRETSAVGSIGSSDRGSSESRSQASRDGTTPSGKMARFFKRNSTALN